MEIKSYRICIQYNVCWAGHDFTDHEDGYNVCSYMYMYTQPIHLVLVYSAIMCMGVDVSLVYTQYVPAIPTFQLITEPNHFVLVCT